MAGFHVMAGATEGYNRVAIRKIHFSDVNAAFREGAEDFWDKPSHYVFLCLIYPIVGVFLISWTSGNNALPLLFPLMSGFALLGPIAALGLYEISRRREKGADTSWRHAFDVRHSSALPSIAVVGIWLFALFIAWLLVAKALYISLFGPAAPASMSLLLHEVFYTQQGHQLIIWGNLIGLAFAIVALATTVIAFPLLLDRDVGVVAAVEASARSVMINPLPMLYWGLIVAVCLVLGSIPFFAGLAVVIPILGHATWHLYRRVIEPNPAAGVRSAQSYKAGV
ncbi:DUF2189 domain-containing protein [Pseudaminobacter soli (ex Li et al. 2025)]|uniref:DUF2189 domain-containing protein n=1 Tax=Pseudaminobacter soli (ex Li et al. 2025) TaxID=1295366 RepID=A0A2P7SCE2_9HYPH|nr:DUF2189 domain-containing protein [Mesorhizobium soli]PSJ60184.1 hypothetical protein C7I85_13470 [Mesorhizobium soli]